MDEKIEEIEEVENELILVAMDIILNAGNARNKLEEALNFAKEGNFETAMDRIKDAKEDIRLAHLAQTQVIQSEMSGKVFDPTLLFNHAQDTLMTIMSEVNLTRSMIELYEMTMKALSKQ